MLHLHFRLLVPEILRNYLILEKLQQTMLVLHFPDKKVRDASLTRRCVLPSHPIPRARVLTRGSRLQDYKLNFVAPEDREMFCAKLVDLCKDCKINHVEPLQEVRRRGRVCAAPLRNRETGTGKKERKTRQDKN